MLNLDVESRKQINITLETTKFKNKSYYFSKFEEIKMQAITNSYQFRIQSISVSTILIFFKQFKKFTSLAQSESILYNADTTRHGYSSV